MTEFGAAPEVPEADRAEQTSAVPDGAPGGGLADDAPEADAIEQGMPVVQDEPTIEPSVGDREANEADVLEQELDVPLDEADIPS